MIKMMMDKEKVIEKIARSCGQLCKDYAQQSCSSQDCEHCNCVRDIAKEIYDCVLKSETIEVCKETAKEILQTIWDRFSRKISDEFGDMASDIKYITLDVEEVYDYLLGDLAEEYGAEVDE